jgi:hypothetical protein
MPIFLPPWLRAHWFFFAAALIVAGNWFALPGVRADLPRLAEPAALFDLAVLLPALYWLSYRHRRKDAVLRALALSCLAIWAVSKMIPHSEQQLLIYLTPLRYVGLAVLVAIEIKIFLALYRTVFSGATRDAAAAQIQSQADLPPWLSRLFVAEAVFWRRVWLFVERLFRR